MQILVNGMISGLTIAVLALAFMIVYLPTRVFYIALGGIYSAVPFIAWTILRAGLPWYLAVIAAISTGVILSVGCELANHARLECKKASSGAHLISSLGIYIVTVQAIAMIWGNETKVLRTGNDMFVTVAGIVITRVQITAIALSIIMLCIFYFWLRFANLGLQFRALADNSVEFALRGYSVNRLRLLAFGISGVLCSASTLLVSYDIGFDPHGGLVALLPAVVAVIIGGRDSFLGPVLGGILLGLVRSGTVLLLSARWQNGVTFLILALFLFILPNGLLGQKRRLEASP